MTERRGKLVGQVPNCGQGEVTRPPPLRLNWAATETILTLDLLSEVLSLSGLGQGERIARGRDAVDD